jgi:Mn2+/Fe2+ NRAMP family transporter
MDFRRVSPDLATPGAVASSRAEAPPGARVVHSVWAMRLMRFAMVVGPGLIVMVADNDAGAVSTYTEAGARYGTHVLWLLALLLPATYFIQEMVVRLGIVTGQGHAAMIYKRFGTWWGVFSLVDLLLVNFLTLVTEFAMINLAVSQMFGGRWHAAPYLFVPLAGCGLMALVLSGSYRKWERWTIGLCFLDLIWLVLAVKLGPSLGVVAHDTIVPSLPAAGITGPYVFMVIAIVGTTIAPWQLFFQQSCVADKKLRFADLNHARLDTFIGALIVCGMAGCMMVVGWGASHHGMALDAGGAFDPGRMAKFLGTAAGPWVRNGVLILMCNAAVLGATTVSLASAWAYGEVKQWPHSLQLKFREAPSFYLTYALCVAAAAGLVLIPRAPLELIILGVQVLAGIMLPSAIIFLQLLLNDKELLGAEYINRPWNNWVNWTIIIVFFMLSLILAAQVIAPNLLPSA